MEATVRVKEREGQTYITIPPVFLACLAIKNGDNVSIYLEGDAISIFPRLEPAAELQRILIGCTSEILERDRENRGWLQIIAKGKEC